MKNYKKKCNPLHQFVAPPEKDTAIIPTNPCVPSPCGQYSQCRTINGAPSCSCLQNYFGTPPNCKPQCIVNSECRSNNACVREKCIDPCPGSCGLNAKCDVINHTPICSCVNGYIGNPFTSCQLEPEPRKNLGNVVWEIFVKSLNWFSLVRDPVYSDPCNPSPCGSNAQCLNGICSCLPEFQGDPYAGCRPECVLNSDCPKDKACLLSKCKNPCPGTCAHNALCEVINHIPMCSCPSGMEGNAFVQCSPIPRMSFSPSQTASKLNNYWTQF